MELVNVVDEQRDTIIFYIKIDFDTLIISILAPYILI